MRNSNLKRGKLSDDRKYLKMAKIQNGRQEIGKFLKNPISRAFTFMKYAMLGFLRMLNSNMTFSN